MRTVDERLWEHDSHVNKHFGTSLDPVLKTYFILCYQLQYSCGRSQFCKSCLKHQKMRKWENQNENVRSLNFSYRKREHFKAAQKMCQTGNQSCTR